MAGEAAEFTAVPIQKDRCGQSRNLQAATDDGFLIHIDRQIGQAVLFEKRRDDRPAAQILGQGNDGKIVPAACFLQSQQGRHFPNTRAAPGRPKIHQYDFSAEIGEISVFAVFRAEGELRYWFPLDRRGKVLHPAVQLWLRVLFA